MSFDREELKNRNMSNLASVLLTEQHYVLADLFCKDNFFQRLLNNVFKTFKFGHKIREHKLRTVKGMSLPYLGLVSLFNST